MAIRRELLSTMVVALVLVAGCGRPVESASDIGGFWWAEEIDGVPIEVGVNTAEMPWFEITGETIGGSLGCNGGGGEYALQGDAIVVLDLTTETQLCTIPDGSDVMVLTERILRDMLSSGGGFQVSVAKDVMTWSEAGAGHVVTFRSADGEPPPPTTEPATVFDRLRCDPGVVVEERHPDDGITPEQLAREIRPETVRVEAGQPLQWWGYDADGVVVVGVFLGDVPDPDYQVVRCST